MRKLSASEKIFLSLIVNILLFGGVFALQLFGVTTNSTLMVLAAVISLEVIYLSFFIQTSVNNNTQSLKEMEKYIENINQDEEKSYNVLIYIEHQLKAMQQELNALKRGSILKANGNGHLPKLQA